MFYIDDEPAAVNSTKNDETESKRVTATENSTNEKLKVKEKNQPKKSDKSLERKETKKEQNNEKLTVATTNLS